MVGFVLQLHFENDLDILRQLCFDINKGKMVGASHCFDFLAYDMI